MRARGGGPTAALGLAVGLAGGLGCGGSAAPGAGASRPGAPSNTSGALEPQPLPDPLRAWLAAPTCPAGAVLVGARGEDLECWDVATTLPRGPSVAWQGDALLVTGGFDAVGQHGLWTWYHPRGGVQSQGWWRSGRKVGVWHVWSEAGALLRAYDLGADGTGVSEVWRDDALVQRRSYRAGCPHGVWQTVAPDGRVVAQAELVDGAGEVDEIDPRTGGRSFRSSWRGCHEWRRVWFDAAGAVVTEELLERQVVVRSRQYQGGVLTAERTDHLAERRARVQAALAAGP